MTLTSIGRGSLADLAAQQLRGELAAGTWVVGARLPPEGALAEQLGVGRSTVREAVRALAHAGQLEVRQGAGTFVLAARPTPAWELRARRAEVLDVYEVREALEVQAARLAAERRTTGDLEAIERTLAEREARRRDGVVAPFVEADLAFHVAVVAACGNALLVEMFASFASALREALVTVVEHVVIDEVDDLVAHRELAAAIRERDPDAAAAATRANVTVTARSLRAANEPQDESRTGRTTP